MSAQVLAPATPFVNIALKQGVDFAAMLTLTDQNGNPIDLTSYTFEGMIRATPTDPVAVPPGPPTELADFVFVVQDQIAQTGQVLMTLDAPTLASMSVKLASTYRIVPTDLAYDVLMNDGTYTYGVMQGAAQLYPVVTR